MLLSDIKGEVEIVPNYWFRVIDGESHPDYLTIVASYEADHAGAALTHPAILAKTADVFEYKHTSGTRKWWTQAAGWKLYFVVPKNLIEVVKAEGNTFPKVIINGEAVAFSTGGGTRIGGGWTDTIIHKAHLNVNVPVRVLKKLLQVALSAASASVAGIKVKATRLYPKNHAEWTALAVAKTHKARLQDGDKLYLGGGYTVGGSTGPFECCGTQRASLIVRVGDKQQTCSPKYIDWPKVAAENKWENVPTPAGEFNLTEALTPSVDEREDAILASNPGKLFVIAAWGKGKPGFVTVAATPLGSRGQVIRPGSDHQPPEPTYYLVPEAEYDARDPAVSFVVDPAKYEQTTSPA